MLGESTQKRYLPLKVLDTRGLGDGLADGDAFRPRRVARRLSGLRDDNAPDTVYLVGAETAARDSFSHGLVARAQETRGLADG